MNTEELYIWRYGIDKLPKGLLEYGKSDVCDTYDESKRQKFQNHGRWMWKDKNGWEENLPIMMVAQRNIHLLMVKSEYLDSRFLKSDR